jgi:hypothetical protein
MKRLLMIIAFVAGTALYVFTAALASNYVDLYVNPAPEIEVEEQVKGSYVETDLASLYSSPEVSPGDGLYDKNVGTTLERDYYYALGRVDSSDSHV